MKALSEKAVAIIEWAKENEGTCHDAAEALGVSVASVTGTFNSLVKKGLAQRTEVEVEGETEGKTKTVKLLELTPEGIAYDPTAEVEAE